VVVAILNLAFGVAIGYDVSVGVVVIVGVVVGVVVPLQPKSEPSSPSKTIVTRRVFKMGLINLFNFIPPYKITQKVGIAELF
jgi:hypothetical protein